MWNISSFGKFIRPDYISYYDTECIIHWEMQYVIYLVFRLVTFEVVHSNSSTCMGNASNTSEKKSTVFFGKSNQNCSIY